MTQTSPPLPRLAPTLLPINFTPVHKSKNSAKRDAIRPAYWHDSIIDLLLAEPMISYKAMAAYIGVSVVWLSLVRNSDAFKARYEFRRSQISSDLADGIQRKLQKVVGLSLDILESKLETVKATGGAGMSPSEAAEMTDTLLTRLGYGAAKTGPSLTVNNLNAQAPIASPVSASVLLEARAEIREAEERKLAAPATPLPTPPAQVIEFP